MKCSTCHKPKDESEFYRRKNGKPITQCKTCHNLRTNDWYHQNRTEQQAIRKERYKASGHALRTKRILDKHGITAQQLLELHREQNDCCAICHKPESIKSILSLDHSHQNGKVRGLLCTHCNLMLGQANDDIMVLREAIRYLERWQNVQTG